MKITIITLFPKMIEGFVAESILKRAQDKGTVQIQIVNLRDFARDSYGTVDERPYGGGAGMVLRVDVLKDALSSLSPTKTLPLSGAHVVLTSARGTVFTQKKAQAFSQLEHLVIFAGHYEGFDERFSDYVQEEISIGDFILTGGELAAATICDSIVRLLPGVLKKDAATTDETFFSIPLDDLMHAVGSHPTLVALKQKGALSVPLLEYPQYTRPEEYDGKKVPEILLSGDPKKIRIWQLQKAFELTLQKRPDLLEK